jgi:rhodanese-related sulfurtransferase
MNQPVAVPEVMSADLPAGVFLLDVREDDEWTAGHAPEAVHVRLGDLGARLGELPSDRELYVICRMTGWAVAGRPMVSEDGTEPHVA